MTPRRQETSSEFDNQPVRLYKTIALTFLVITIGLLGIIVVMSAKRTEIVIETKSEPITVTGTAVIRAGQNTDGSISGVVTSTLIQINHTFTPLGSAEEEGISTGSVLVKNISGTAQPLVATTRLLSPDGILFRLKKGITVPAGGSVSAEVYADAKGGKSDIDATHFTIPGLNEGRQKEVSADSTVAMSGGTIKKGVLSSDDVERETKILLSSATDQAKTLFLAAYPNKESVFKVVDSAVDMDTKIGESKSSVTISGRITVVAVLYAADDVRAWAGNLLSKRAVDDTEIVQPSKNGPTVTLDSYDLTKAEASLSVFNEGLKILNPESKGLAKTMFFGKSNEEVRRYVLSLEHVRGVEVKFFPAWMMSVPHIADHVTVVVKNVE